MKDNKIVAEFMVKGTDEELVLKRDLKKAGTVESMQYHTSWDWLMPVIEKICDLCFSDGGSETTDSELFYMVRDCIPDISDTYEAVVNFITRYNNR